ncbi:hypothetical protein C8R45DRAFT_1033686, partial [Mycena sanguinolenta]
MRTAESQVSNTQWVSLLLLSSLLILLLEHLLSLRRVSFLPILLAALPSFKGPHSVFLTTYIPNSDTNAQSARCTTNPPARSSPL